MLIKNGFLLDYESKEFVKRDIKVIDGKIHEISDNIINDDKDIVIDATNMYITPGLIDAHSHICISEEGMGQLGDDCCDYSSALTPELEVLDAIYPFDKAVESALKAGVTTACICPGSDGVVGGMCSTIEFGEKVADKMIVQRKTAIKCSLGENPKTANHGFSSRMGTAYNLRKCFEEALEYKYKKENSNGYFRKDFGMENMLKVLNKEIPIHVHAHRSDDICTAIRIAKEYEINMVIVHGTDAISMIDYLAENKYPIILGPSMNPRGKQECWNKTFETAKYLSDNKIKFCITADHDVTPIYYLVDYARMCVKNGLDELEALKAITKYPAEILGIQDKKGDIKKGLDADLVFWTDHPFSNYTRVKNVFVRGNKLV